jgi:hypothetical protein
MISICCVLPDTTGRQGPRDAHQPGIKEESRKAARKEPPPRRIHAAVSAVHSRAVTDLRAPPPYPPHLSATEHPGAARSGSGEPRNLSAMGWVPACRAAPARPSLCHLGLALIYTARAGASPKTLRKATGRTRARIHPSGKGEP